MTTVPYVAKSEVTTPGLQLQETGADSTVSSEVRENVVEEGRPLDIVLELLVGSHPVPLFEDRKSAQALFRGSKFRNFISKVTLLPRKTGVRLWLHQRIGTEEVTKTVKPYCSEVLGNAGTVKILSDEQVHALTQHDAVYRREMQSLETTMTTKGLELAADLASLLKQRKNNNSATNVRKQNHLINLTATVNMIAAKRMKVNHGNETVKDVLEKQNAEVEEDDDDDASEDEDLLQP
jgi:hypothetical protein